MIRGIILTLVFCNCKLSFAAVSCANDRYPICYVDKQQISSDDTFEIGRSNGVAIDALLLIENKMPILPSTIFISYPNITFLSVSQSEFKQISVKNFANAGKLKKLFFQLGVLTRLSNGTFKTCISLENLQINSNKLSILEINAFQGLKNLNNLALVNNSIEVLHPLLFANLPNLVVLMVENNRIKKLSNQLFLQNPSLYMVSFNFNQLTDLPADLFRGNDFINTLSVTNNLLTSVRTFGIKFIDFGNNKIKTLQIDSGLEKILIENNFLEVISCENANLSTIKRVFFTNNSLTNFNCIRDMENLTEIEASMNNFVKPTLTTFAKLTQMKYFKMFNQKRILAIGPKVFSTMTSLSQLRVDRLVEYRNLAQLFPSLFLIGATTTKWNCSYTKKVVKVLNTQKLTLTFNIPKDREICNIQQTV